ncbi:hypothetical protein Cme02nite_60810 [Catellatospora methionotrophica]|uniref:DUF5667 domain-containing protein n=1 Tax=Catellatospora methionotrophica TaxID=121620 RepID=A0A8J3PIH4_9ACTN|nr:DUF5667 domain-containing protein [Catellatospora methionotrophica]GIG17749.1 hypothetical protein Cme02nite_60810 [Catellatospora methionotrophica]
MNNISLFDRGRAERFAQLVDEANGGRRHHTRSRLDSQLAELVTVGQQLRTVALPGVPEANFKRDLRAQLIATAERDGIGVTARTDVEDQRAAAPWTARKPGRARARGAIVIGIAAGTLALSGVSVASGEAIPGDALYGVKRQTEKAQLALAGSDLSRGRLYLEFARTRLSEAHAVRTDATGFGSALTDMDADTTQGIRMLITSAMARRDTSALDAVDRFVADQRMLVGQLLDGSTDREKVTGSLSLLDRIEKRSAAARTALACGAGSKESDRLGSVPGSCANAVTQPSRPEQQPQPVETRENVKPNGNGTPAAPQASIAPSASASPAPGEGETEQTKDDGLLDELGRILGGLLG